MAICRCRDALVGVDCQHPGSSRRNVFTILYRRHPDAALKSASLPSCCPPSLSAVCVLILRMAASYNARRCGDHQAWPGEQKRAVLLGSGYSVVEVLTALSEEGTGRYQLIGILDDDARHHGSFVRGIKVLGELDLLFDLLRRHDVRRGDYRAS